MRGPRPLRIFLMVILALTPLAQSFWLLRAWRVIDTVAWPGPRYLLQSLWSVAALTLSSLAAVAYRDFQNSQPILPQSF
jgi:hypothetical protein